MRDLITGIAAFFCALLISLAFVPAARAQDTDGDLLPDVWESTYSCLSPLVGSTEISAYASGAETRITYDPNSSMYQDIVWTGSEVGMVWTDNRNGGYRVYFARLSATGAKIGSDVQVSSFANTTRNLPAIAWTGSEFGLSWDDAANTVREVYFARVSAVGTVVQAETRITNSTVAVVDSTIAWNPTNARYAIVWTRAAGDGKTHFTSLSSAGVPVVADVVISDGAGANAGPEAVWNGNGFGISWDELNTFRRLLFVGVTVAGDTVAPQTVMAPGVSSTAYNSNIAWTGTEYGIVWSDTRDGNYEIYFNRLSATGAMIGSNTRITNQAANSYWASLSWTGSQFDLTWQDERVAGTAIFYAPISSTGIKTLADHQLTAGTGRLPLTLAFGARRLLVFFSNSYEIMSSNFTPVYRDRDGDGLTEDVEYAEGTSSCLADTDGDGLSDYAEIITHLTNPLVADTDSDGLTDGAEINIHLTSPLLADTDGEGLSDGAEINTYLTDPLLADTDGDGLNDGAEINTYLTDPLQADTDNDELDDYAEINNHLTDPLLADSDADGLNDYLEAVTRPCLDPRDNDSDNDGVIDGTAAGEDKNNSGATDAGETDACDADTDDDGLNDGGEGTNGTNPWLPDTDGDGLLDGAEINTYLTDPLQADTDNDELDDYAEINNHLTDPLLADSDADGLNDYLEAVTRPCLDPRDNDSDNDGVTDGTAAGEDKNNSGATDAGETDACDADTDDDGLNDGGEGTNGTNPWLPDTDGDGLSDGAEVHTYVTLPLVADSDGDGLNDYLEAVTRPCLDPRDNDSDNDGVIDGTAAGEDKNNNGATDAGETDACDADTDDDGLNDGGEGTNGTNPWLPDTDGDGLSDGAEINTYLTDPLQADSDNDELDDYAEINNHLTDPLLADSDADGLNDYLEAVTRPCLNPQDNDSDNDGVIDGTAAGEDKNNSGATDAGETDACDADTDDDGLNDGGEGANGTNPWLPDTDGDGLSDGAEVNTYVTLPLVADSDGDELNDYLEAVTRPCLDPRDNDSDNDGLIDATAAGEDKNNNGATDAGETDGCDADTDDDGLNDGGEGANGTNPWLPDTDGDGLSDGAEVHTYVTLPLVADSDGDGLNDYLEAVTRPCLDPRDDDSDNDGVIDGTAAGEDKNNNGATDAGETDACDVDTDDDGLNDGAERTNGTNPWLADTDGDGAGDTSEILAGSNPINSDIFPRVIDTPTRITTAAGDSDNPSLAWNGSEYGLAWNDMRNGNSEIYFTRISTGGMEIGDDVRFTSDETSSQAPFLKWTGSQYGVAWQDNAGGTYKMYFARISAAGVKLGPDVQITSQITYVGPASLEWTGSEFGLVWDSLRLFPTYREIIFARLSETGSKITESRIITSGLSNTPSLAWTGSEFGISYNFDYSDIENYFVRVSSVGAKIGTESRITSTPGNTYQYAAVWNGSIFGIPLVDGAAGNEEIYFVRVGDQGTKLGSESRITQASGPSTAAVIAYFNSSFFIVWQDARDGNNEIYFTELSQTGAKLQGDLRLTNDPAGSTVPAIAWNGSELGLAWTDTRDGNSEIYFSRLRLDYDGDGLSLFDEQAAGTNGNDWDTDNDQLGDKFEVIYNSCVIIDPLEPTLDIDFDADGLTTILEFANNTNPCDIDTDDDGLSDTEELNIHGTDPLDPDIDDDGLTDGDEINTYRSDPLRPDTDFGCLNDGAEVSAGKNPLDPTDDNCSSTVTIGTGTSDCEFPINTFFHDGRAQTIYRASEIGIAANLTSLDLYVTTIPGQVMNNFSIRLKHTALASYSSASWETGWTTVYQANAARGATGWRTFAFTTPFAYNGTSNLIVDISFNNASYSTAGYVRSSTPGTNRSIYFNTDSGNGDPLTWSGASPAGVMSTKVPNIRLGKTFTNFSDTDGDGMPDAYETYYSACLNVAVNDAAANPDADGLTNVVEYQKALNPCNSDTDSDTMPDGYENANTCLNARVADGAADADTDVLANLAEFGIGTNPCAADTDGDGLSDGNEVSVCLTNPLLADTDEDGLTDGEEVNTFNTDPGLADSDGDNLNDGDEIGYSTNPNDTDTDGDGLEDGDEVLAGADPLDSDSDGDSLTDGQEVTLGTSPINPDSDGDGLGDGVEHNFSPDPTLADSDSDGLSDSEEALYWLTDPMSNDTDGDGMADGWETAQSCLSALITDGGDDPDGDGQTNHDEFRAVPSTDPCALIDSDADGMSDWWETNMSASPTCVLNPAVSDAALDPDSDGRTNLVEYTDRTDPCVSNLLTDPPRLVNYQGRLTDSLGAPASGSVAMSFSLFADAMGGTAIWSESHTVTVTSGIYNVTLGSNTLIPASALALPELYLEITAGGQVLVPRQKITAVPLAMDSMRIEGKRFEAGTRTLNVSPAVSLKTVHVSFDRPFVSPPRVTVTDLNGLIGNKVFISTIIANISAGGFDVTFQSLDGAAAGSATFGYNAFGE